MAAFDIRHLGLQHLRGESAISAYVKTHTQTPNFIAIGKQ